MSASSCFDDSAVDGQTPPSTLASSDSSVSWPSCKARRRAAQRSARLATTGRGRETRQDKTRYGKHSRACRPPHAHLNRPSEVCVPRRVPLLDELAQEPVLEQLGRVTQAACKGIHADDVRDDLQERGRKGKEAERVGGPPEAREAKQTQKKHAMQCNTPHQRLPSLTRSSTSVDSRRSLASKLIPPGASPLLRITVSIIRVACESAVDTSEAAGRRNTSSAQTDGSTGPHLTSSGSAINWSVSHPVCGSPVLASMLPSMPLIRAVSTSWKHECPLSVAWLHSTLILKSLRPYLRRKPMDVAVSQSYCQKEKGKGGGGGGGVDPVKNRSIGKSTK